MPFRLLTALEQSQVTGIFSAGITMSSYNMVAQYLAPRGYGWAQATGIAKRLIPGFSGVDFAEHWYRPYQKVKQEKYAIDTQKTDLLQHKDYIQHDLKEPTRYMYEVEYKVFDDEGNMIDTQSRAFYSDDELAPEDIEDKGQRVFKDTYEKAGIKLSGFNFKGAYHNRMWDY